MINLENPFFKSNDEKTESDYVKGVSALQKNDFYGANKYFAAAADGGHISAVYNLSLINGSGLISPYNIDYAIDCYRVAAFSGHPKAQEFSLWLDKAEDTSLGASALSMLAEKLPPSNFPNHVVMMIGCRLYSAFCEKYGSENEVIAYELDAASHSDHLYIHNFIKRTGVSKSIYSGGLDRLKEGSHAEATTDLLNELHMSLKNAGNDDSVCLMARCTIVGYIISKSKYADLASPLLGVDKFFD